MEEKKPSGAGKAFDQLAAKLVQVSKKDLEKALRKRKERKAKNRKE